MYPELSHHTIQEEPLQSPTLVPPLASFPPLGPSPLIVPYARSFKIPSHYISLYRDEMAIMDGALNGLTNDSELDVEEDKKRSKLEPKKRSKNWSRLETLKLIRLRTILDSNFAKAGRKTDLWEQIAQLLQKDMFIRDGQQCRDKWEKLMAGYKEVRDGLKNSEDNPFYEELQPLLSRKSSRRDNDSNPVQQESDSNERRIACMFKKVEKEGSSMPNNCDPHDEEEDDNEEEDDIRRMEEGCFHKKKHIGATCMDIVNLQAIQTLLETLISRQQKIFKDFLGTLEKKEQQREEVRQEREDKWKAEERAQSRMFNNVMIMLAQKLVGDGVRGAEEVPGPSSTAQNMKNFTSNHQETMKRSRNWKRDEVVELIKLRGQMEAKFCLSTRRAALWEELSDVLGAHGINRDRKQCREKWDKLMSEYKDVVDGKRQPNESHYFHALSSVIGNKLREAG